MSGAHRPSGRGGGSVLSVVASSALAGLAVTALVGVLILAFGENDDDSAQQDRPAQVVTSAPSAVAAPDPLASPSAVPSTSASPSGGPKAPVVILNQTVTEGLAATFRAQLRAGGWKVPGIGDFRGNVPATTVYYPPGLKAAATALMSQFAEVGRIRPAFAGISTTQLTVILGKDFPTSA